MSKSLYDIDNDGIIDKAKYSESTNWDGILNKPLFYTPSSHTHSINDIDGEINATKLNGLNADQFLKKNDKITISQIEDISDWDFGLLEINGGTSSSTYEDTLAEAITDHGKSFGFWLFSYIEIMIFFIFSIFLLFIGFKYSIKILLIFSIISSLIIFSLFSVNFVKTSSTFSFIASNFIFFASKFFINI